MQGKRLSGHRSLLRKNSFGGGSKAGNRQNCFKCGKPGHWSRSCPNNEVANFSRKDSSSNKLEGNSSKTFSLFHRQTKKRPSKEEVAKAKAEELLEEAAKEKERRLEILDEEQRLTEEQMAVVKAVENNQNVLFTGSAGCGKSFLLNHIVKRLPGGGTFVTATTGIAAVAVGGTTLHSFAGIGLGELPIDELVRKVNGSTAARGRWQDCNTLIIDEISMLDADLFEKLEQTARRIRRRDEAFGGIQVILSGDFLQLPPVSKGGALFAFRAPSWNAVVRPEHVYMLRTVFRQKDSLFIKALNELRLGLCSPETQRLLQPCLGRVLKPKHGVEPTRLYARKAEVRGENEQRLAALQTPPADYTSLDTGKASYVNALQRNCQAPALLQLKEGAQVMLIKNLDLNKGLFNGSRGIVKKLQVENREGDPCWKHVSPTLTWPIVQFTNGVEMVIHPEKWEVQVGRKTVACRLQVPLILAWSLTIHKCQGMTLDWVSLSLGSCFEMGQAYVALSRVRALEGLSLVDFSPSVVKAHADATAFYQALLKRFRNQPKSQSTTPFENGKPSSGTGINKKNPLHKKKILSQPTVSSSLSYMKFYQQHAADFSPPPSPPAEEEEEWAFEQAVPIDAEESAGLTQLAPGPPRRLSQRPLPEPSHKPITGLDSKPVVISLLDDDEQTGQEQRHVGNLSASPPFDSFESNKGGGSPFKDLVSAMAVQELGPAGDPVSDAEILSRQRAERRQKVLAWQSDRKESQKRKLASEGLRQEEQGTLMPLSSVWREQDGSLGSQAQPISLCEDSPSSLSPTPLFASSPSCFIHKLALVPRPREERDADACSNQHSLGPHAPKRRKRPPSSHGHLGSHPPDYRREGEPVVQPQKCWQELACGQGCIILVARGPSA